VHGTLLQENLEGGGGYDGGSVQEIVVASWRFTATYVVWRRRHKGRGFGTR
jgi:hypothetical protein